MRNAAHDRVDQEISGRQVLMCGVVGLVGLDIDREVGVDTVERMCQRVRHRGPDDVGTASRDGVHLGMRRLAIVDIAGGHQPMGTEDGSLVIVYNGEIYNAPELRRTLQRDGVHFRSRSDTEVILRLYARDPYRVEPLLRGMWAFAIHDRARRKVVLSRDRFGIKPLFVADTGEAFAFASELGCFSSLRGHEKFSRLFALDPGSAHAMLAWSFVPEQETIFSGVRRVKPGTRIELDLSTGRRSEIAYFALRPSSEAARVRSMDEACDLVEPILRRAVREHLEADVPIAAFVSGGIDSALVAKYAVESSQRPIETFAIGFREQALDEARYARRTANILDVPIHVTYLDEPVLLNHLVGALAAYDEPFGDSSSIATFVLSQGVAQTHKVALGGDGADEAFAGYRKYRVIRAREALGRFPGARDVVRSACGTLSGLTERTPWWSEALRTARRFAQGLQERDADAYVALTQVANLARTAPLVREPQYAERFERAMTERYERASGTQLRRYLISDFANSLPNDMLTKVDRASMRCSLEVRVPFLDHELVETGLGLPESFSAGHGGKAVLRALHARAFGARLANRPKHGFMVPVARWLRSSLKGVCDELFAKPRLSRHGLLRSEALSDGRWRDWAVREPQILWHAFSLAAWCEQTFESEGSLAALFERHRATPGLPPSASRSAIQ
jgi:asparagine synthase (glutamine-hydrolysing)